MFSLEMRIFLTLPCSRIVQGKVLPYSVRVNRCETEHYIYFYTLSAIFEYFTQELCKIGLTFRIRFFEMEILKPFLDIDCVQSGIIW